MKFIITLLLQLAITITISSQAIEIDFEDIPNTTLAEGIKINTQFFDDYGITFSLENGKSPTLAKVGSPVTAFISADGDDTPIGTTEIGNYFITDDGELSGLESSALIINFMHPISIAEGQILDIDYTESFIIEAYGIDNELLSTEKIEDGDIGTGDGLASQWKIGIDQCLEIYSLKLEGHRTQAGEFGLGIDNFTFYPTVDIENIIIKNEDCGIANGQIEIITNFTEGIQYSIDGVNYSNNSIFNDLPSGLYTIYVKENENCIHEIEAFIESISELDVFINITPSSCGTNNDNGQIEIISNEIENLLFSINGTDYSDNPVFNNLSSGVYNVYVKENENCTQVFNVSVEEGPILEVSFNIKPINCEESEANGQIEIITNYSNGLQYSINGIDYSENNIIDKLLGGSYTVSIKENENCIYEFDVHVDETLPELKLNVHTSTCGEDDGIIDATENKGFILKLNNKIIPELYINNLYAGDYHLTFENEIGCFLEELITIKGKNCPIYIPNIFSPNNDGKNDYFYISTHPEFVGEFILFEIYDRWGNLVFKKENFQADEMKWDGSLYNKPCDAIVYSYIVKYKNTDGIENILNGAVHLIR